MTRFFAAWTLGLCVWYSDASAAPLPPRLAPQAVPSQPYQFIGDLDRFPHPDCVREAVVWSLRHREWLRAQQQLDLVYPDFWAAWLYEAEQAALPWEYLALAYGVHPTDDGCGGGCDEDVQLWADCLRWQIGEERWGQGMMPSVVASPHRFRGLK